MKPLKSSHRWISVCLGLLLIAGCATTPPPNPALEQARQKIAALSDNPEINRLAAGELQDARNHLSEAEQIWQDGAEAVEVSHRARMAMRQADIAVEAAQARQSDQQVERLSNQRERLSLEARTARAELAASRERLNAERERARTSASGGTAACRNGRACSRPTVSTGS